MENSRIITISLGVLLALALAFGVFFCSKSSRLTTANEGLTAEVDSLNSVKYDLLDDIDSLQTEYQVVIASNDSVGSALSEAKNTIASQKEELKRIKRSAAEADILRREITQLRNLKAQLEGMMDELRAQNQQLIEQNTQLTADLQKSQESNQQLTSRAGELESANKSLQEEMDKLRAKSVKATSLRVDVGKRNDKLTTSSRRARNITVSFDLIDVPQQYHGMHTLYLVITNEQGVPVKAANPIRTTIRVDDSSAEIEAQVAKDVVLEQTQRLVFNYAVPDRLERGTYRASIYTSFGLLGSVSFRLT